MKVVCINAHKTRLKLGGTYTVLGDYQCGCRKWFKLAEAESGSIEYWKWAKRVRCRDCRTVMPLRTLGMYKAHRFVPLDDSLLSKDEREKHDLNLIVETT